MASAYNKIDELDFEVNGSAPLREYLDKVRQLALTFNLELVSAAGELQAALEKTPTCTEKRSWETDKTLSKRAARQVARGIKRQGEYALAIAQLSPRTWAIFFRNYMDTAIRAEKRKPFKLDD